MLNAKYLDKTDAALQEMEDRLWDLGRNSKTEIYTTFVNGIIFHPVNFAKAGTTYQITSWDDPNNRILIGEYLSYISIESYQQFGFMASALVISDEENMPSQQFFDLARTLGAIGRGQNKMTFWSGEVTKAYAHYQNHPTRHFVPVP